MRKVRYNTGSIAGYHLARQSSFSESVLFKSAAGMGEAGLLLHYGHTLVGSGNLPEGGTSLEREDSSIMAPIHGAVASSTGGDFVGLLKACSEVMYGLRIICPLPLKFVHSPIRPLPCIPV